LNWPIILVVLLVVAAIALWLWWPEEGNDGRQAAKQAAKPAPFQPNVFVSSTTSSSNPSVVATPVRQSGAPTPVATVVATPGHKVETASNIKVMPRVEQRRPA
jgi:hypothetical protein